MLDGTPSRTTEETDTQFGFTWVEVDGQYRLRSPDAQFKEVSERIVETLRRQATEHSVESLIAEVASKRSSAADRLREMHEEGYIRDDDPVERIDPPTDVALWPQVAVTLLLLFGVGAVWVDVIRRLGEPVLRDPTAYVSGVVIVGVPVVVAAFAVHEYGHYWTAARQGLDPSMGFTTVNGLLPAVITRTHDGWLLPRNRRVAITLAGPVAGLAFTGVVFGLYHTVLPSAALALAGFVCFNVQLFALFPLFHGDGYLLFTDLLGEENLRRRGVDDLFDLRPSVPALYVIVSYGIVLVLLSFNFVVAFLVGDLLGVAFVFGLVAFRLVTSWWNGE